MELVLEQLKCDLGYFRTVGIGLAERHFQFELVPRTAPEQLVLGVFICSAGQGTHPDCFPMKLREQLALV